MDVDPGRLNKQIRIIRRTSGELDSAGFETESTETLIRECWAQVSDTSGSELIASGQEMSKAKRRFLVRDNGTRITTDMVIQYDDCEYDIKYVNSYGDSREYLEIWTERRNAPCR